MKKKVARHNVQFRVCNAGYAFGHFVIVSDIALCLLVLYFVLRIIVYVTYICMEIARICKALVVYSPKYWDSF